MQIDIPEAEERRLANQAAAHGFDTVGDFVNEVLLNISRLAPEVVVFAPLEEDQVAKSKELLARGEEDLKAGRVREMREGLMELGRQRGLI